MSQRRLKEAGTLLLLLGFLMVLGTSWAQLASISDVLIEAQRHKSYAGLRGRGG